VNFRNLSPRHQSSHCLTNFGGQGRDLTLPNSSIITDYNLAAVENDCAIAYSFSIAAAVIKVHDEKDYCSAVGDLRRCSLLNNPNYRHLAACLHNGYDVAILTKTHHRLHLLGRKQSIEPLGASLIKNC